MSIAWGLFSYSTMTGLLVGVCVTLVATLNIIFSYDNVIMQDRQLAKSTVLICLSFFNHREKSPEFLLERFGLEWASHMHGPGGSAAGTASDGVCEFSCGRGSAIRGSGKMTPKELWGLLPMRQDLFGRHSADLAPCIFTGTHCVQTMVLGCRGFTSPPWSNSGSIPLIVTFLSFPPIKIHVYFRCLLKCKYFWIICRQIIRWLTSV